MVLRERLRNLIKVLKLVDSWMSLKILLFILTHILTESGLLDISMVLGHLVRLGVVFWVRHLILLLILKVGVCLHQSSVSIMVLL